MDDHQGAEASGSKRRRPFLVVLFLSAVVVSFSVWVLRPNTVPVKPTGPGVLRVVTYNVKVNKPSADAIDLLGDLDADVILLQEVVRSVKGDPSVSQPTALIEGLQVNGYFAASYDDGPRTESQMILSRYPISDGEIFDEPDRRGVGVAATIDVDGWPVRVYSVHLSPPWPLWPARPSLTQRRREAERIADSVGRDLAASVPVILGGDFNASPHARPQKEFSSILTDCASAVGGRRATLPKIYPLLRYDVVFVSGEFTPLTAGEKRGASDHLAVIVDVRLSDAPQSWAAPVADGGRRDDLPP